jgi:hypothetical protein
MRGRYSYLLQLAVLTTAASIGCGGGSAVHHTVAAGQLAVSPARLNFGQVPVGQQSTVTGTITAGDSSVAVTSADWSGEGFSVSGITFPITVAAGQSVSFTETFAPQKPGSSVGNISFLSDASNSPHTTPLKANATQPVGHAVTLSWKSGSANVAGYNIYRGITAQGPFTKLNSDPHPLSSFTDGSVQAGATYFYMTTALNKSGKESKFSNPVQVTIPNS